MPAQLGQVVRSDVIAFADKEGEQPVDPGQSLSRAGLIEQLRQQQGVDDLALQVGERGRDLPGPGRDEVKLRPAQPHHGAEITAQFRNKFIGIVAAHLKLAEIDLARPLPEEGIAGGLETVDQSEQLRKGGDIFFVQRPGRLIEQMPGYGEVEVDILDHRPHLRLA